MYKIRNKVYADAGHILVGNKKQGYVLFGELDNFCEKEISINDMKIENNLLIYGENNIKERYDPTLTYEQLKTKYIKKIFSNDDQIALILNKDKSPEDLELFNKMQEWRDWCGVLAKKVVSLHQEVTK